MKIDLEIAYFAGGCFWCTEAVYQNVIGVIEVTSGFTGGHIKNPAYREICQGRTGHAEAVEIKFDTSKVNYLTLLEMFFDTHDPTTLNRQGNDVGTHYRSAIFYTNEEQKQLAENYIEALVNDNVYDNMIVTEISKFKDFYPAEEEHQNFYNKHTFQPYCQIIINPKLDKLKAKYRNQLKH